MIRYLPVWREAICQGGHNPPLHAPWLAGNSRAGSLSFQCVITERARIGQVGYLPAIQIVLGHALLSETLELVGVARRLGAEQAIAADLLGRAPVVDLVELVAATELCRHTVPKQLHEFDALLSFVAVGAAQIAVEIRSDLRV